MRASWTGMAMWTGRTRWTRIVCKKNHHYMITNRYKLCYTMRWIFRIVRYVWDEGLGV